MELSLAGAGQDCTDLKWVRTTGKAYSDKHSLALGQLSPWVFLW